MIELPHTTTLGDLYGPAMHITDEQDAQDYLTALVLRRIHFYHYTREDAHQIEIINLRTYARKCGNTETLRRVERLFC